MSEDRRQAVFLCYFERKADCHLEVFYLPSASSKMFSGKKSSMTRATESEDSSKQPSAVRNGPAEPCCAWRNLPLFQFNNGPERRHLKQ